MWRSFLLVVPVLAAMAGPLGAQVAYRITPLSGRLDEPDGGFSASIRFVGKVDVTFSGIGNIASPFGADDATSELGRIYDDGAVNLDARRTDDGIDLPDDGRTNTWVYGYGSQVTPDGTGIMFHRQSAISDGSTMAAESKSKPGVDLEYTLRFGSSGAQRLDGTRPFTWGGMFGFGFSDINAKSSGVISATLVTLTDTYSLDGAVAPPFPYTAPSSQTITGTADDGTDTSYTVDTTVLLANKPYSREITTEVGGADVLGFWQVKGVTATLRTGPWVRWRPASWWSLRASAGVTFSYLGLEMRYDELINNDAVLGFVRETKSIEPQKYSAFGYYGALDAELWLTARTAFFGSFVYERTSSEKSLSVGGRTANVRLSGGSGFRFGITTLF